MWTDRWTGKTIARVLEEAVEQYGDREAMVFPNARLSYRDLLDRGDEAARAFLNLGIRRGDRVAIWMAGYAEWAYAYHGLLKIGAIIVPLNTRYRPAELEYVLRKAEARVLLFRDESAGAKDYATILEELCPELERSTPGELAAERAPELRWVISVGERERPGMLRFSDFIARGREISPADLKDAAAQVTPDDLAMIQFTSGTTAFPKGAQLFQAGMLRGSAYNCALVHLGPEDRFFSPQPFYHAGGSIQVMLSALVTGCTTIVQPYFDAAAAIATMDAERCTITMGHQPHFIEYLNQPREKWNRLNVKKGFIFANADVNRLVVEQLGITGLLSPYGMTETHLGGTGLDIDEPLELRRTTVGRPVPGVELEIRDPATGAAVPPGEVGEVCLNGWCLMRGYYHDPERTAEAIGPDGWFHTGDLGSVGEDGCLRLRGRLKEMIRVGGENVAAAEVEGFLIQHPSVKQVVVVGRPEPRLGEVCVAFVEPKAGMELDEEDLLAYCRKGLASFKVPRQVFPVDDWPMSGTGKIQRFLLEKAARESASPQPASA